jgi:hypothetical protein
MRWACAVAIRMRRPCACQDSIARAINFIWPPNASTPPKCIGTSVEGSWGGWTEEMLTDATPAILSWMSFHVAYPGPDSDARSNMARAWCSRSRASSKTIRDEAGR